MRISTFVLLFFVVSAAASAPASTAVSAVNADRNVPLFFIPNQGQAPGGVRFMAKGSGLTAYFLSDEVAFRASGQPVRLRFEGAAPGVRIEGDGALSGRVNFFTGSEDRWRTGIPVYSALEYRGLYTGIDLSYGIAGSNLKSEFIVAPGADPRLIRIRYLAAGPVRIDSDGALLVPTPTGSLRELPPIAWQTRAGVRVAVKARFAVDSDGAVSFALGGYDPSLPLIVDPVLSYSTFLGGSSADAANAIAVDASGAAYIAGFTESYDLPTLNPEQSATGGGNDAFVAKLSASGSALIYCTYLGGTGDDRAFGIAIDSAGAAYVTGSTQSSNFPIRNAYQANLTGAKNAFAAKLTPTGNNLAYSTYLGGNGSDAGNGIAIDSSGSAYIVGDTTSTNFPVNSYQRTYRGGQDAFVVKLNAGGNALAYSTYLGGGNTDHGAAIAVDSTGAAFVTGSTSSTDFPTLNALQPANGGGQDAFISRLNPTGSALLFSTYLGGSGGSTGYNEAGQGIALDAAGNAYVAGVTASPNFPLLNPLQSTLDGFTDAFISKVSSAGALLYSTYLGGSGMDVANAIAVDSNGNAYVAGYTYSTDFPVVSALQSAIGGVGSTDAFVAKLVPGGNSLAFATYLGGNDSDTGTGVAIDSAGNIYVTGWTLSSNFPTLNPYQSQNAGNYGAFATKYVFNVAPDIVNVTPSSGSGNNGVFTLQYSDGNGAADFSVVGALFGASSNVASACAVVFNRAQNTLSLLTDGGAQPASTITPGSGTAQNSQCILNGGASSVLLSGDILSLTLALTFQPAFAGTKNIYMQAANLYQTTPWQTEGSWTVPAFGLSVSPSSGGGAQQNFTFQFTDLLGANDLTTAGVLFNSSANPASACAIIYNRAQNTLALLTDSGAQPSTTISPGGGTAQNSQCTITGSSSSASVSGNTLTVSLQIAFLPAFAGVKNIYMEAADASQNVNWTAEGTWATTATVAMSVTPSSGSGSQQTFSVQVTDSLGATDLTTVGFLINSSASTISACAVIYNPAQNTLALLTDAGAQPASTITPGSGTQSSSQCTLSGSASSVTIVGMTMTLNLAINFQPVFSGVKNMYMEEADAVSASSWQSVGSWEVTPTGVGAISVMPSSGSSFQQTFALRYSDSAGANDLSTVWVWFTPTFSPSSAKSCILYYARAGNQLNLLTDATNTWQPGTPGASGTLSNSQCSVNLAAVSTSSAATDLVLTLPVAFSASYSGLQQVFMYASGSSANSGWQNRGNWTVPVLPPLLSISSTHAGNFTSGQVGATYTLTASNQSGAGPTNGTVTVTDSGTTGLGLISMSGSGWICSIPSCTRGDSLSAGAAYPPITLTVNVLFNASSPQVNTAVISGGGNAATASSTDSTIIQTAPVSATSLTPNTGSGITQSFTLSYSDSSGAADLSTVWIWFTQTFSSSSPNSCLFYYARTPNQLNLLNDSGSQWQPGAPGTSGVLSNGQCSVALNSASVSISGANLTLTLPITFASSYAGTKNIYMYAAGSANNSGWQNLGTWTVPTGLASSLSQFPALSISVTHVGNFTLGESAAAYAVTVSNQSTAGTTSGSVIVTETLPSGLTLSTMSGAGWSCTANVCARNDALAGGASYPAIAVGVNVSTNAASSVVNAVAVSGGGSEAANDMDTTTIIATGGAALVTPVSASLNGGASVNQTFQLRYSDQSGAADLKTVWVWFNSTTTLESSAATCMLYYDVQAAGLYLFNDSGTQWLGPAQPGSAGSLRNSQCSANMQGVTVNTSGVDLILTLPMTFDAGFYGTKNIYMYAVGSSLSSTWQSLATWTAQ